MLKKLSSVLFVGVWTLLECSGSTAAAQAVVHDAKPQVTLADLQQQLEELKASFVAFKEKSTELEESLSKASTTLLPVGSIVAFAGLVDKIPSNWKLCDGKALSYAEFPVLWERIGITWGGTGREEFKLPDLRGIFLRGVDGDSLRDPDAKNRSPNGNGEKNAVGSTQEDALQTHKHADEGHTHPITIIAGYGYHDNFSCGDKCGALTGGGTVSVGTGYAKISDPTSSANSTVRVASETRVKNADVFWIIRVN